jgi:hypothetical protein
MTSDRTNTARHVATTTCHCGNSHVDASTAGSAFHASATSVRTLPIWKNRRRYYTGDGTEHMSFRNTDAVFIHSSWNQRTLTNASLRGMVQ